MRQDIDYFGLGTFEDPFTFAHYINYFLGVRALCEHLGLNPRQRRSHLTEDGLIDVVHADRPYVFSKNRRMTPRQEPLAPMAWIIRERNQIAADLTWEGERALSANGPAHVTDGLLARLEPLLQEPNVGLALDETLANLPQLTDGVLSAEPVARMTVLQVLARKADPVYAANRWPELVDEESLLSLARRRRIGWRRREGSAPSYIAGGTTPDGRELWVTLLPKGAEVLLVVTEGPGVPPRVSKLSDPRLMDELVPPKAG